MADRQRELFSLRPPILEEADAAPCRRFAQVVFNRPMRSPFTYAVPKGLEEAIQPGQRVLAPFGAGNRRTTGYCVAVTDERTTDQRLKVLHSVLDAQPLIGATMLELTRWMAERYYCGWGQVLEAVDSDFGTEPSAPGRWPRPQKDRPRASGEERGR